jgi:hypothetical protein
MVWMGWFVTTQGHAQPSLELPTGEVADAASAQAGDPPAVEDPVTTMYVDVLHARFRQATTRASALLTSGALDAMHYNRVLELKAIAHLALREPVEAESALTELYGRDPGHVLALDMGPVVYAAFARAREAGVAPVPVALQLIQVPGTRNVQISITGGDAVEALQVGYRRPGEPTTMLRVQRLAGAPVLVKLPVWDPGPTAVEVSVEALAPSGYVLARLGRADAPILLALPALVRNDPVASPMREADAGASPVRAPPRWTERWWFWPAVGLVGGTLVGGALLLAWPGGAEASAPSLGRGALR